MDTTCAKQSGKPGFACTNPPLPSKMNYLIIFLNEYFCYPHFGKKCSGFVLSSLLVYLICEQRYYDARSKHLQNKKVDYYFYLRGSSIF